MRLAVLADIHGNLPALEAVVADLAGRRVGAVVNLGDCVSGPLWPSETLGALRREGWPTVRGNHDRWVGGEAPLGESDAYAAASLDEAGRAWLAALPPRLVLGPGIVGFHARPDDDNAYLLEDIVAGRLVPALLATVAARLGATAETLILTAHSHLAGIVRLDDGRAVVNPGSVGAPAYDDPDQPAHVSESGSPLARYAVIEIAGAIPGGLPAVDLIAVPYDHAAAARRALDNDRPEWAYALRTGTMPKSLHPRVIRAATGAPTPLRCSRGSSGRQRTARPSC